MHLPTKDFRNLFADVFAVIIFLCCMTYFFWASFFLPKDHKDFTHIAEIKTAMITICTWVVGFYYGSVRGAKQKDDIIRDVTDTNKKLVEQTEPKPVT